MYFETIQQQKKMLNSLAGMLDKAAEYAKGRNFSPDNFVTARLAPDMFPFARQVQVTCDTAKFAASRLTGKEAPKHEDNETTLEQLSARVRATIAFLDGVRAEDFAGSGERHIVLPFMKGQHLLGSDYLTEFVVPNFYFHLGMSYALLRQGGVPVGKMDYIGSLALKDDAAKN